MERSISCEEMETEEIPEYEMYPFHSRHNQTFIPVLIHQESAVLHLLIRQIIQTYNHCANLTVIQFPKHSFHRQDIAAPLLARGINYFVPHAFDPKEYPDWD